MRTFPDTVYGGLKTAFRRLVSRCGGPKAAAEWTRVGFTALNAHYSVRDECREIYPPADVIADLEHACGDPVLTREMARVQGYDLVPMDSGQGEDGALHGRVASLTAGRVVSTARLNLCAITADDDGKLSNTELADLICQADADYEQAAQTRDHLRKERARREGTADIAERRDRIKQSGFDADAERRTASDA